mmetsp:Transcript_161418/g.518275  ORF Transcript_161418/g.518275 Transcript_161418/m.518275 type:complete len:391 (-) Transcript_161418:4887-6059(-)
MLLGPDVQLLRKPRLIQGSHRTLLAARDDISDVGLVASGAAGDEVVELDDVLDDQIPAREGREEHRGDNPSDNGDQHQDHREFAFALVLHGDCAVDAVGHRQAEGGLVVRLPVCAIGVLPSLVLIRRRTSCEEVLRNARFGALFHGLGDVLVLENEEEGRGENPSDGLLHSMHSSELQDKLTQLWDEGHEAHRDDPLSAEGGTQGRKLAGAKSGQVEEDEHEHVQLDGPIDQQVAHVECDGREVEGQRVHDADALAEQVVVAGPDHRDAAAGNLREKVRGRIEGRLSPFLELQCIDVRRRLLAQAHVVAGENVFAEVDHRRALAHASTIPSPEAIQEVRMPVVHADAQSTEEALVDRTKRPLRSSMALTNGTLAAGVNVFAESKVAAAGC